MDIKHDYRYTLNRRTNRFVRLTSDAIHVTAAGGIVATTAGAVVIAAAAIDGRHG